MIELKFDRLRSIIEVELVWPRTGTGVTTFAGVVFVSVDVDRFDMGVKPCDDSSVNFGIFVQICLKKREK